ncbi:MAG: DUF488 domain-containing protein [Brumimicrobium sp.]|nr:DUF488 domain-containing protein [Brumimicrobium sp.]MCO5268651.1 DUF488 domain-containing protein [Brumimicrobium sp.]
MASVNISIKRIYEESSPTDGYRILVDRVWPRGVSKEKANIEEWMKEIAPSTPLRKWFNHEVDKYAEFKKKYSEELKSNKELLEKIHAIAKKQQVTLTYGAKDEEHNQAVVLKEVIERM